MWAGDTLKIMHYNLLHFANITDYCSSSDNHVNDKENWISTIFHYARPDVFTVNELSSQGQGYELNNILDHIIYAHGVDHYDFVNTYNRSGSSIMNGFFYNTRKLGFYARDDVYYGTRDIDFLKMYLKTGALQQGDTLFLHFIVTHFKAGTSQEDKELRLADAEAIMRYLEQHNIERNVFLCGDLNVRNADEAAFQELIAGDYGVQLEDPLDDYGDWHNNADYAFLHTQSTVANGACKAGGGMDDRFDFILSSDNMLSDSAAVQYIQGTYEALGQDGDHLNASLNASGNNAAPDSVIHALVNNSDHLPVCMELEVPEIQITGNRKNIRSRSVGTNNPVGRHLYVNMGRDNIDMASEICIRNSLGIAVLWQKVGICRDNRLKIDVSGLKPGIYYMQMKYRDGITASCRFIKK